MKTAYYQFPDGQVYQFNHVPSGAKRLTKASGEKLAREQARETLRGLLKAGDTVYTVLKHVSRSGMMRHISVLIGTGNDVRNISGLVSTACGIPETDGGSLKVGGCGMDMGFHVVYSLGRALYPEGFKLAANQYGRNGDKSGFDIDGGYAFRQSWI